MQGMKARNKEWDVAEPYAGLATGPIWQSRMICQYVFIFFFVTAPGQLSWEWGPSLAINFPPRKRIIPNKTLLEGKSANLNSNLTSRLHLLPIDMNSIVNITTSNVKRNNNSLQIGNKKRKKQERTLQMKENKQHRDKAKITMWKNLEFFALSRRRFSNEDPRCFAICCAATCFQNYCLEVQVDLYPSAPSSKVVVSGLVGLKTLSFI